MRHWRRIADFVFDRRWYVQQHTKMNQSAQSHTSLELRKQIDTLRHATYFDGFLRALWWERLDPTRDPRLFARRLYREWERCFVTTARRIIGPEAPQGFDMKYGVPLIEHKHWTPEWFDMLHSYHSFHRLLDDVRLDPDDPCFKLLEQGKQLLRLRVSMLSPAMIGSISSISTQYMLWLRHHPQIISRVSWKAFERIVAEVFASRGFAVEIKAPIRDESCDLLAVRADEFGVQTRYLIECKKYNTSRRVGLSVVNQVLGAARRQKADHAFLVTTSKFTRDVVSKKAFLRDLRLHLRDGTDIAQWIREYKPRTDLGL